MAPPGGSATLYGVLYQLLASVHHAVRLRLERQGDEILGARIVVEPAGGGGDLRIEQPDKRRVEQWKARTNGKPWSLKAIVGKVLPDLYLDSALDDPGDKTEYVFVTEGHLTAPTRAFFERLRAAPLPVDPLTGVHQEGLVVLTEIAKAARKRKQFRAEPDDLTYPKLRRLLSRFKIREDQKAEYLITYIDRWLLPLLDLRDDREAKRQQLCTMILEKAAYGEVVIVPEDLLREASLRGVSLGNVDELRSRACELVYREVERRGYDRDRDVRAMPSWPEDKPFLVVAGESGQGKTWQLARLAVDLGRKEDGNKILAVFVVSRADVTRAPDQAADLLWKQAWDHDHAKTLDRVAAHCREVQGDTAHPWLAVCVDGLQSLADARALIDDFDWESWGVRLALSVPRGIGIKLASERPDQIQLHILRDFTLAELRKYLRLRGRISEDLPPDVRETLRRPLLAGIYAGIGSGPDWKPTREYEIYEEYWRSLQKAKDQEDWPEDLERVKRLALSFLDEEPRYPWSWEQLEQAGLTEEPRKRLEHTGWWIRTEGGMEVWHDRLVSWALAEAVAERGADQELKRWLQRERRSANPRIRRILAYLPLDVLWLLSSDPVRSHLVPGLIVLMEGEDRHSQWHGLYEVDLPSLGDRIVPSLIERLRRVPDDARYSHAELAVKALSKILSLEPGGREDLPPLLRDSSRVVREVAVGVLARHPHPEAIELLWDRLRGSSRSIDDTQGEKGFTTYKTTFSALRACLDLNPSWLRAKILDADAEREPVWDLAYLLANVKHSAARSIWMEVKSDLFRKMPLHKLRCLAVCVRVFLDSEEAPRLEEWLSVEADWTDIKAFRALAWVNPDRAVMLLATLPLKILSDHSVGSWLPILLLKRPEETRRSLRDRMKASEPDFWEVADLYRRHEEAMDRETAELLLDRLSSANSWDSLRRPLGFLVRLHRLDLLQAFEKRARSELDRRLGEVGTSWVDSPGNLDLKALRAILLKIGGEGIRSLIRAGLASPDAGRQGEALYWGTMIPEEIGAAAPRTPAANALLGECRSLVEAIIALEAENPWQPNWRREWLTALWHLRRGRPPMTNEELAPAFAALGSDDLKKRMRGLDAMSISGRTDLLSHLEEWLEGFGELAGKDLQELDLRAAYLIHRLAADTPESVQHLCQVLDFARFPRILGVLYGQAGAESLPDRLEQHLLRHVGPRQFGALEMDFALTLSRSKVLDPAVLRLVWNYGRDDHDWNRRMFWEAVAGRDFEDILEEMWKASQDRHPMEDERFYATPALARWEPVAAFDIAAKHLSEPGPGRSDFVQMLIELDLDRAVPLLLEQATGELETEVLWTIARNLRRVRATIALELGRRLESPDFAVRNAAAHLAGWMGAGFLKTDLQRMATEDPDDEVRLECLESLDRQDKERCVLELMHAFHDAEGTARWSYLESILQLGDPHLLTMKGDPLWIDQVLTPELGVFVIHTNFRLQERFEEVKRAANQRDANNAG